ncbi:MAG: leucyl aminopeptidase [Bacillota bacterium]
MKSVQLLKNARKLVEICGGVKPGEKALVVTDYNKLSLAEAVAAACHAVGAEVVVSIMIPRRMHNEEIPKHVAAAMREADVIFAPTTWSIAHTKARVEATKAGARVVNMPSYEESTLIGGAIDVDFEAQARLVRKVAEMLTAAKEARVYTDLGTDIRLGLEGRQGAALTGLIHNPGEFGTPPDVEARITPVEGTSEGVIVVDGSIPVPEIGLIRDPIRVVVKQGRVTEISGGEQARVFRELLESQRDPEVYNIAELGIGLNPKGRLVGVMVEDEGSLGTVHIAVGTSAAFGGKVRTSLHLDMMIRAPVVELDGRVILDRGALRV